MGAALFATTADAVTSIYTITSAADDGSVGTLRNAINTFNLNA
jgi:hypothetical protein